METENFDVAMIRLLQAEIAWFKVIQLSSASILYFCLNYQFRNAYPDIVE
jgi:hypothetical protein